MPKKKTKTASSDEPPRGHFLSAPPLEKASKGWKAKEEVRLRRNARRRSMYAEKKRRESEVKEAEQTADVVFIPEKGDTSILPFTRKVTHTITLGETIFTLGIKYGVLPTDIKAWNDIRHEPNRQLPVGSKVIIYQKCKEDPHPLASEDPTTGHTKLHHIQKPLGTVLSGMHQSFQSEKKDQGQTQGNTQVQHVKINHTILGERPEEIAGKYGVTVFDIMRWNGMKSPSEMEVGKTLEIYPDADYLKNKGEKHPNLTWVERLHQENANLRETNETIVAEFAEVRKEYADLARKLETERKENKRLKEENGHHLHEIFKAQDRFGELVELRKEKASLLQDVLDARDDNQQLVEGQEELLVEISKLSVAAQKQVGKLRQEVMADRQRLVEANQQLRKELAELKKSKEELSPARRLQFEQLAKAAQDHVKDRSVFMAIIAEVRDINKSLKKDNEDLKDHLQCLSQDHKRLKDELDARNSVITSMPRRHVHVVKKGETAYSIAKEYGVTVSELIQWNNLVSIRNPLLFFSRVGNGVLVWLRPSSKNSESDLPGYVTHVVQKGESIEGIAAMYGTALDSLVDMNSKASLRELKMSTFVGTRLIVKRRSESKSADADSSKLDETSETKIEQLQTRLQVVTDQRDNIARERADLEKKVDRMLLDNSNLRQEKERNFRERDNLGRKLDQAITDKISLQDENKQLENQVASFRKANEALTAVNRCLREDNENLHKEIEGIELVLRKRKETPIVYQNVFGEMGYRLDNEALRIENDDLRLKLQGAFRNNEQLRKENDELNSRLDVVTHTRNLEIKMKLELYKKYEDLFNEADQLRKQVEKIPVGMSPVEAKAINLLKELLRDMKDGHAPSLFNRGDWFEVFADLMDVVIKEDQDTTKSVKQPNKFMTGCVESADCDACGEHDFCKRQFELQEKEKDLQESPMVDVFMDILFPGVRHSKGKVDTEDDLIHVDDLKKQRAEELKEQSKNDLGSEDSLDAIDEFLAGFSAKGKDKKEELFRVHHPYVHQHQRIPRRYPKDPTKEDCDRCPDRGSCSKRVTK